MPNAIHILSASIALSCASCALLAQDVEDAVDVVIETTPETDPEIIEEWIEQLGSDDWLMRDLATLELAELDPGITLETLEHYVQREDLSHEQRARLRLACLRRFALRPKGALGVQFGTIRVGAIEVQPIPPNPEFPASMILKAGDQIAMVGDRVIDGTFSLRAEILSRDPGSILPVTLIRDERVMRFDLMLGEYSNLTGGARMDSDLIALSLQLRWERNDVRIVEQGSVGDSITIEDWKAAAFPEGTAPDSRDPELVASRGFVLGPGVEASTDGTRWNQSMIDVWANPAELKTDTQQRNNLLVGEEIQPMIALRLLLERERDQVQTDITKAEPERTVTLSAYLDTLTSKLDTITREIESVQERE